MGNPGFLNVAKTGLSYKEQKESMQKEYVSSIIESAFLQGFLQDQYSIEELKAYIDQTQEDKLSDEIKKIFQQLEKMIQKGKQIQDIKEYLEKNLGYCTLCGQDHCITSDYTESNFIPLAVSSQNMTNFFWNQNVNVPICDICKLILFCIPAGVTKISKIEKDAQGKYSEKERNSFVNYDTSVEMLLKINNNFRDHSKQDKTLISPFTEIILDIVEQEKQKARWKLENIFVVEFESEYLAYSRMEYFNIQKYVAEFLAKYANNNLEKIKDYQFKIQILDHILKNKSFQQAILDRIRETINASRMNQGFNCYLATCTNMNLKMLKKEGQNMTEEIQKNNKKLYALYSMGVQIHEELKKKKEDNKLDSYIYRMLNSIKANNRKEFMDIVIRLHLFMKKDVFPIFLEIMQEEGLSFEDIGQSFLSGLISNEYRKNTNVEEMIEE